MIAFLPFVSVIQLKTVRHSLRFREVDHPHVDIASGIVNEQQRTTDNLKILEKNNLKDAKKRLVKTRCHRMFDTENLHAKQQLNKNKNNWEILLLKIFHYKFNMVFLTQHVSKTTAELKRG